jgi:hypothetical protein
MEIKEKNEVRGATVQPDKKVIERRREKVKGFYTHKGPR